MTVSLPHRLAITVLAPLCVAIVGCSAEPRADKPDMSTAIDQTADVIATAAGVGETGPSKTLTVAEIMEVVDGGSFGNWAVAVRFPNGLLDPCFVEVTDTRSGKLLIRDEVPPSDDENLIHETQFAYKGRASALSVRVTEGGSGTVLATSP